MKRIAEKFVPHLLNNDHQDHRVQVCTELRKAVRHDPNFLFRVTTGDESWLYSSVYPDSSVHHLYVSNLFLHYVLKTYSKLLKASLK